MTALDVMTFRLPAATLKGFFDLNDNGQLGWPDLLATLFFGTVGLLAVMVLVGMSLGVLVVLVRVVTAAGRRAVDVVRL